MAPVRAVVLLACSGATTGEQRALESGYPETAAPARATRMAERAPRRSPPRCTLV